MKGSGRIEAPMIDPIDFAAGFAGGLKALFSTGIRTVESQGLKQAGKYFVYQATDEAGVVRYVGITSRNVTVRAAEHQVKPVFQNLTFTQVESGFN